MIKLIIDKLARITKNRKKLEEILNVIIIHRGTEVYIDGEPEDEYVAEKVINALNFGFPFSVAIEIKKEDLMFEVLNIKHYTNQKNLARVRGRIIGAKGKTIKIISELSNCYLEIKDNKVGIIGEPEFIKNAQEAIISIAKGTKQANVYNYLEKHRPEPLVDLGLKPKRKNKL